MLSSGPKKAPYYAIKTDKGYLWRNGDGKKFKYVSDPKEAWHYVKGMHCQKDLDRTVQRAGIDKYDLEYVGETEYFDVYI